MTTNYALINKETNVVDNICAWDGNTQTWTPPSTHDAIRVPDDIGIGVGWTYENGAFVEPVYPEVVAAEGQANVSGAETL